MALVQADARFVGLAAAGSFASGTMDEFSDAALGFPDGRGETSPHGRFRAEAIDDTRHLDESGAIDTHYACLAGPARLRIR